MPTALRLFACLLTLVLAGRVAPAGAQTVVRDLPTVSSGMGGSGGVFTLYSLRDGRLVLAPDAAVRTDSASTAWDIGFQGTTIIVNGGASGPGAGRAALLDAPFDAVTAPPADGLLLRDGDRPCPSGPGYVVCTGSENGWYLYAGNGVIKPLPDKTLVVHLAEGGFAKLRVLDYVLAGDTGLRHYTIEYALLGE